MLRKSRTGECLRRKGRTPNLRWAVRSVVAEKVLFKITPTFPDRESEKILFFDWLKN